MLTYIESFFRSVTRWFFAAPAPTPKRKPQVRVYDPRRRVQIWERCSKYRVNSDIDYRHARHREIDHVVYGSGGFEAPHSDQLSTPSPSPEEFAAQAAQQPARRRPAQRKPSRLRRSPAPTHIIL